MSLERLTTRQLDEVVVFDLDNFATKDWFRNHTRLYLYLLPVGHDMQVHGVAVKHNKIGQAVVKEVLRASVDDPFLYVTDMMFQTMAGYYVDWYPQGIGRRKEWAYNGRWYSEAHKFGGQMWKIDRQVVNPGVLQQHERFRWCAWKPGCGHILDYLKAYKAHPKIELLAKAGAERFCTKIGFIQQLERDKGLLKFLMEHLKKIQELRLGVPVIQMAYRRKIGLDEAEARVAAVRTFRGTGKPRAVEAYKAAAYLNVARGCNSPYQYAGYLRNCLALGMDLADTKVAFPKNFARQYGIVKDRIDAIERKKRAELAQEQDKKLAQVAARYAALERAGQPFRVVLPRRAADFEAEGKRLQNCLGDGHYAAKMARGETLVAFVRRAERPSAAFVAVEWCPAYRRLLQCYGANNAKPPAPVVTFVESTFKRLRLKPGGTQ